MSDFGTATFVYTSAEKARSAKRKLDECTADIESKTSEWEALAAELEVARAGN